MPLRFFLLLVFLSFSSPLYAEQPESFAFALGIELNDTNLEKLRPYELIVIDGTDISKAAVQELKQSGAIVLGYASAGTIERGRPWSKRLIKKYGLTFWEDWGEWFAAVSKRRFRRAFIRSIAKPILEKDVDGLFLDNVDMIEERPKQAKGMMRLLKQTRKLLGPDKLLFIQNGDSLIPRIERSVSFDGWNREDVTSTYNFDTESYERVSAEDQSVALQFVQRMLSAGYIVTTADYTAAGDIDSTEASIEASCASGATPFVADIFLQRLPDTPQYCSQ